MLGKIDFLAILALIIFKSKISMYLAALLAHMPHALFKSIGQVNYLNNFLQSFV